jgi:Family of unknown function (DUF6326)
MSTGGTSFEEAKVNVRLRISALWIAMLFLFAYGDIFGFFQADRLEEVMRGEISGITITQGFLFAVSVYIAIASLMVFLTLVLRRRPYAGATSCSASCTSSRSWPRRSARRARTTGS